MEASATDTKREVPDLIQSAKEVLEQNWTGSFTKPAPSLYPHQWSWDTAFIAMGMVHYKQQRAEQELRHLFKGQWDNGMVPHIVFNEGDYPGSYFPGPEYWETGHSPHAPEDPATSGICQPPIHATAVRHMIAYAEDQDHSLEFAHELFPKLKAWHNYLYRERDPADEGLVYIQHPWESGQDNSPAFDPFLKQMELESGKLPGYKREDLKYVEPDERPTDSEYDRYFYLINFFHSRYYDEKQIRKDGCPFLVQDVLFNALLCRAEKDLAGIAELVNEDPAPFLDRAGKTASTMNEKHWNEEDGIYLDIDFRNNEQVKSHELSGFMPLFAGIPNQEKAERLFDYLNSADFCGLHENCLAVPSYDRRESGYSPTDYWRGPIWINLNWMLRAGLLKYGHEEYAQKIKNTIIELVRGEGFHEYYDPDTGDGYGSDGFSWSASLFLDICFSDDNTQT